MGFYEKVIMLCRRKGVSRSKMADDLKISRSAPQGWEKGRKPQFSTMKRIADYFNVPVEYLLDSNNIEKEKKQTIQNLLPLNRTRYPILGEIVCGEPIYADEQKGEYIISLTNVDDDFCLTIKAIL